MLRHRQRSDARAHADLIAPTATDLVPFISALVTVQPADVLT